MHEGEPSQNNNTQASLKATTQERVAPYRPKTVLGALVARYAYRVLHWLGCKMNYHGPLINVGGGFIICDSCGVVFRVVPIVHIPRQNYEA